MTKSANEWYAELRELADKTGEIVADRDAWMECFEKGMTPEEALYDEYPEHKPAGFDPIDVPAQFVTEESIKAKIKNVSFHVFEGTTLTHCTITLENGYTVTGESACVRPENFNKATGEEWAFKDALKHIWKLEGYLLKQRLFAGDKAGDYLVSSNIKRDNSLTLAEMIIHNDLVMNTGAVGMNEEQLAAEQDKYVAMIDFAKEIIAINRSTDTLQA